MNPSHDMGEHLLFVGGAPRSGTTLVQTLLNRHPVIHGGPEFDLTPAVMALRSQLLAAHDKGRIDRICNREQIDQALGRLLRDLLLPAARRNGKRWFSEKTPANVLVFDALLDALPAARFIHVVRDPRAVSLSMLAVAERYRMRGKPPPEMIASPGQVIQTLLRHVEAGVAAAARVPERVYTLRYEALVRSPEPVLRSLCDFIGVAWSPRILANDAGSHLSDEQIAADGGIWLADGTIDALPEKTRMEKWKDGLDHQQQRELSDVFASLPVFAGLGYRFDDLTESASERRRVV